mmetsp:Transcript_10099/g.16534  ORF Transcript_10099/g.16534 Transcript_10099/m.16534 type:complete len:522 (+) Transcript_10099:279-1844(+)
MGQCACGAKNASSSDNVDHLLGDAGKREKRAKPKLAKTATKLLLLGTGNSGKSTVFKQYQLLHNNGFSSEEREYYRGLMVSSTIATIRKLLQNANDLLFEGEMKDGEFNEGDIVIMMKNAAQNNAVNSSSTTNGATPEDDEKLLFSQFLGKRQKRREPRASDLSDGSLLGSDSRGRKTDFSEVSSVGRPSDLGSANAFSGEPALKDVQSTKTTKRIIEEQRREHRFGGSKILSDEVTHLADIIRGLPDGTELYEKIEVPVVKQDPSGNQIEEVRELIVADMLKLIWNDPVIQRVYSMEGKLPTLEAPIAYYMRQIDRIAKRDFSPTDEDILHSRKQTRKVQQLQFKVDGKNFCLIDVGGQQVERRHWLSYFEDVDAVLFIVGLDGYNQLCIEDGKTNRMREALQLFKDICESPYFIQTNILLFLNKSDIFKEKILETPLSVCFRSYQGPKNDYESSLAYINQRFVDTHTKYIQRNIGLDMLIPKVYSHVTCATATEQMRFILITCQSIFLRKGMQQCGLAS